MASTARRRWGSRRPARSTASSSRASQLRRAPETANVPEPERARRRLRRDHAVGPGAAPMAARRGRPISTCSTMRGTFELRAAVLRMGSVYGPRQLGDEDHGWVTYLLQSHPGGPADHDLRRRLPGPRSALHRRLRGGVAAGACADRCARRPGVQSRRRQGQHGQPARARWRACRSWASRRRRSGSPPRVRAIGSTTSPTPRSSSSAPAGEPTRRCRSACATCSAG